MRSYHSCNFRPQQIELDLVFYSNSFETGDWIAVGQGRVCINGVDVGKATLCQVRFDDDMVRANGELSAWRIRPWRCAFLAALRVGRMSIWH